MIWLLRDFDFLAVLLRAAVLAFEALTVGGIAFQCIVIRDAALAALCRRAIGPAALGLLLASAASAAVTTAVLMSTLGSGLCAFVGADYFLTSIALCGAALLAWLGSRWTSLTIFQPPAVLAFASLALIIIGASVNGSHAASRLDDRWLLFALTAGHHAGVALWIGSMPYLLLALKRVPEPDEARRLASRYSALAIAGVTLLAACGVGLAWFYLGFGRAGLGQARSMQAGYGHPLSALYGTAYGVMLLAKVYLLLLMLALGASNLLLTRGMRRQPERLLARLRRVSEAEIGLGFTAILVAASLTSQPPAVDLVQNRLSLPEITSRLRVTVPSLRSPTAASLAPPAPMDVAVRENAFRGTSASDAVDRAWSDYNHHWAGLVVFIAGALALLSRHSRAPRWTRAWPLAFAGLSVFIVLRADPENWPLGPRPFWASFSQPDVLQHRLYAALLLAFAWFEWRVQAGASRTRFYPLLFPAMCAAGGALLLLHSHAQANGADELLAEINHTAIALLGATAGWSRWLELRLPESRGSRIAGFTWPTCLMLAGLVLLNYRES